MDGLLWRALPGPAWARVLLLLLLVAVVVAVCFEWVFPWLSDYLPMNDNTVEVDAP